MVKTILLCVALLHYTFQGVASYMLPSSGYGGTPLQYWYSQSYGY